MRISQLVVDMSFYPRGGVNWTHIQSMCEALQSGATLPPIVIERKSQRIVDGIHRYNAYKNTLGDDYDALVEERDYADENALWLDAVELNTSHGLTYTTYDRRLILVEAEKRGISRDVVSKVLKMTVDKAEKKLAKGSAFVKVGNVTQRVPLRTPLKRLAGKLLTQKQEEANKKASMKLVYYAESLIGLLEAGILQWGSAENRAALQALYEELGRQLD